MLLQLARGVGLAALVATHNPGLAAQMDRTVRLEEGVLVDQREGRVARPAAASPAP
jgi:ABC-type lipoprotein export system ATPase subunit